MRVVLRKPHKVGCHAKKLVEDGDWPNPWYSVGRTVYRDKNGRKNGQTTAWMVFGCNSAVSDPCPAEVLVRYEDVCNAVAVALRETVGETATHGTVPCHHFHIERVGGVLHCGDCCGSECAVCLRQTMKQPKPGRV